MALYSRDEYLLEEDMDFLTDIEEDLTFEPGDWEIGASNDTMCICNIPSVENLIHCCEPDCKVKYFHRSCVGLSEASGSSSTGSPAGTMSMPAGLPAPVTAHCLSASGVNEENRHLVEQDSVSKAELNWRCQTCTTEIISIKKRTTRINQDNTTSLPSTQPASTRGNEKPRRKRKILQTSNVNRDHIASMSSEMVTNALRDLENNKFFLNSHVSALASKIDCDSDHFKALASNLTNRVILCAEAGDGHPIGPSANTRVCQAFQALRSDEEVLQIWDSFLSEQNLGGDRMPTAVLLQYLLRKVMESVVALRGGDKVLEKEGDVVFLSKEEDSVLRFIAGYVPFALVKRYSRTKSKLGQKYKNTLIKWRASDDDKTDADEFLSYTSVWINLQNRGGLFEVKDKVYRFFRSIEIVVRKELVIKKLVGHFLSAREKLEQAVDGSKPVQKCWEILICEDLDRKESEDLYKTVVNYYIRIRLRNFVRLYVNLRKREAAKVSRKGEKSLRKELKKAKASKHSR